MKTMQYFSTSTLTLMGILLAQSRTNTLMASAFSIVTPQQLSARTSLSSRTYQIQQQQQQRQSKRQLQTQLWVATSPTPTTSATETTDVQMPSFIETELRGAAMRLHTREQAPKEGQHQLAKKLKPYVPTHKDYLQFLVDSKYVYEALEDIVNERPELEMYRGTGLERVEALKEDIAFMMQEYNLEPTEVGAAGRKYADALRQIQSIPEFMCHYYNFYFAHTAGGRMIGKQMSALLLNKKTLEFYKWEGNLNDIKQQVKENIEVMAAKWTPEEKKQCVDATAAAFIGGGAINSYLMGGQSPH